jgi:uncharacterized repeat protein (TIGR01451 family)
LCIEAFPDLPPIAKDDTFTTSYVTAMTRNVLSNNGNGSDRDPEGTALTVATTPIQAPANGSLTLAANGAFTYTPNAHFVGVDSFKYQISDTILNTSIATVRITVTAPTANLVTTKTRQSTTPNPSVGSTVAFKISVTNNGPSTAPNPSLTDLLPLGLTFVSAASSQGTYNSGSGVWSLPSLANGIRADLIISATVNTATEGQTITNTTTATSGLHSDPTTVGDDLSETIIIANPSLPFDKNATFILDQNNDGKVNVGDKILYNFVIKNTGNVFLTNVKYNETAFNGHNGSVVLTSESLTNDSSPMQDSPDSAPAGTWGTLGIGDTVTFTATYTATQEDIDLL